MKLSYKLSGLTALSGASVACYLLLPSFPVENNLKDKDPSITKASGDWKKAFEKEGYSFVDMNDTWEIFPGLLEAFRKSKGIREEGQGGDKLRELCNSYESKETLTEEENKEAKRWCFKPREIQNILAGKGRKLPYKIEETTWTWENDKLKDLALKYAKNQDENLKMEKDKGDFQKLTITENENNLDPFKKACENLLLTNSFVENLDNKLDQATHWCTVES